MSDSFSKTLAQWRSPLWVALVLASLFPLVSAKQAAAHGVSLEYQATEAIEVQGMFDSGEPMAGAQVVVYAPDDPSTPWLTGTTDDQGVFLFKPDPAQTGDWEVQFRQAGHGDVLTIPTSGAADSTTAGTDESGESQSSLGQPDMRTSGSLSSLQRLLVLGAMTWGFVGTALYFSARRQQRSPAADPGLQSTAPRQ